MAQEYWYHFLTDEWSAFVIDEWDTFLIDSINPASAFLDAQTLFSPTPVLSAFVHLSVQVIYAADQPKVAK